MSNVVEMRKKVFDKIKYPNVIDIEFSQLFSTSIELVNNLTVDEFFELYNTLFFEIPIEGNLNSHKYIIKQSTEYVGEIQNIEEIDLLLEEINQLRLELLEARQTIDDLTQ